MPDTTVFVTGTNTEVGKTWLTARLTEELRRRGFDVAARKPVMSFSPTDTTTDALVLAEATGEPETTVCPPHRRYELPMAPPIAAEALGRDPFTIADLEAELALPSRGLVFVEGVGGPRSPLAADGDSVSFIHSIEPEVVVLVAESRLGVINDVLTSRDAIGRDVLVFLNRFDPADDLAVRNQEWLTRNEGLNVLTQVGEMVDQLVDHEPPFNLAQEEQPMEVQ